MNYRIAASVLVLCLGFAGCDKIPGFGKQKELQQRERELALREAEMARREAEQKLEDERKSLERERLLLDVDREELERKKESSDGAAAAEAQAKIQAALKKSEELEAKEEMIKQRELKAAAVEKKLDEKEMELAGREPLPSLRKVPDDSHMRAGATADYGVFYERLNPYGFWYETPEYGYVWQPRAAAWSDWRPYSEGRWVCSDRGWMWVSDEPFGWACYHYGRWAFLRGRGWVWVPGDEWAPAWVAWHQSADHIGWAPLPPETLCYRGNDWRQDRFSDFRLGPGLFVFLETRFFGEPVHKRCEPTQRNWDLHERSRAITQVHVHDNSVYFGGPTYVSVNKETGSKVPFVSVNLDRSRPPENSSGYRIRNGAMNVFAPEVSAPWNAALKPQKLSGKIDDLRPEVDGATVTMKLGKEFRQSRKSQLEEAEEAVSQAGGQARFNQQRGQTFSENRRFLEQQNKASDSSPKNVTSGTSQSGATPVVPATPIPQAPSPVPPAPTVAEPPTVAPTPAVSTVQPVTRPARPEPRMGSGVVLPQEGPKAAVPTSSAQTSSGTSSVQGVQEPRQQPQTVVDQTPPKRGKEQSSTDKRANQAAPLQRQTPLVQQPLVAPEPAPVSVTPSTSIPSNPSLSSKTPQVPPTQSSSTAESGRPLPPAARVGAPDVQPAGTAAISRPLQQDAAAAAAQQQRAQMEQAERERVQRAQAEQAAAQQKRMQQDAAAAAAQQQRAQMEQAERERVQRAQAEQAAAQQKRLQQEAAIAAAQRQRAQMEQLDRERQQRAQAEQAAAQQRRMQQETPAAAPQQQRSQTDPAELERRKKEQGLLPR